MPAIRLTPVLRLHVSVAATALLAGPLLGAPPAAAQRELPDSLPGAVLRIALPEDEVAARAAALFGLARSPESGALEQVVAALADPAVRVADAAQRACAGFTTAAGVDALLGPHGLQHPEVAVRVRAAEALGRVQVRADAARVAAYLPREGDRECLALLRTLERLSATDRLSGDLDSTAQSVQSWLRGKHADETRGAALATLAALAPQRAERYAQTLLRGRPQPLVYGAAIEAAMDYRLAEPNGSLERHLRSRDAAVRLHAVRLLDWRGDREAVTWLVDALEREERLGVAWRIVEALQERTGQAYGLEPGAWRAHVVALPLEWTAARVLQTAPRGLARAVSVHDLAHLEPRSDRLALVLHLGVGRAVVDLTPVAATARKRRVPASAGGRGAAARLPVSDAALGEALAALLERVTRGAQFDLLRTGAPLTRLRGRLGPHSLDALPEMVRFAKGGFDAQEGDLHGALQAALSEPGVDRVLLVERSGRTIGERVDLELIVDEALAAQRFRGVVVDVALVDPDVEYAAALGRLARETQGRLLHVTR